MNTYFMRNLADQRDFVEEFTGNYQVGNYATMMGNDKDFLPTRISYKLNLHGPACPCSQRARLRWLPLRRPVRAC